MDYRGNALQGKWPLGGKGYRKEWATEEMGYKGNGRQGVWTYTQQGSMHVVTIIKIIWHFRHSNLSAVFYRTAEPSSASHIDESWPPNTLSLVVLLPPSDQVLTMAARELPTSPAVSEALQRSRPVLTIYPLSESLRPLSLSSAFQTSTTCNECWLTV